jgi:hypothetical protein
MLKQMVSILTTIIWTIKETKSGIINAITIKRATFSKISKELVDTGREEKKGGRGRNI